MRRAPAGAVCSMRAAMFTAMPRMLPSASTPPPSSTPPVWTPTRTSKPSWPCAASHFGAEVLAELEQGQAAAHGALGVVLARFVGAEDGQDVVAGVLQHLAAVCFDDGGRRATSAPSITALISSGSRCWASAVEPTTSRNRMLTCLSVCAARPALPAQR